MFNICLIYLFDACFVEKGFCVGFLTVISGFKSEERMRTRGCVSNIIEHTHDTHVTHVTHDTHVTHTYYEITLMTSLCRLTRRKEKKRHTA